MANKIGGAQIGEVIAWEIKKSIPVGNERGTMQVVRDIANPLAACREVLFTVEIKESSPAYLTNICQQYGGHWRWATSEPAVTRWGGLQ
ncbi:hypothetical protein L1889_08020 [Paenalcaligenes niemegkensis]|uniref:hypothetical protein n=1 Tax=Paenalcaligenes niemegkensis TaxID=2895469 RepID=UPI001EE9778F|nr:hypothetical protein [Paenalcaligenes niemegkensis]MCQ9616662.1 hypothetical protein [Paenalcaligenes niemegkensis]